MTPWHDRKRTSREVINEVNKRCALAITEATTIAVSPPPIPGLGSAAGFTLEIQDMSGQSPLFLGEQAQKFVQAAKKHPEIGNIYTLFRPNVPQKSIQVDKDKVEKLGLSLNSVNSTVSSLLGSSFVNNFNEFGRQYKTYIMADARYRMKPGDLGQFYIRDPLGNMVPLSTLATVRDTVGPLYTNRFNLYRSAEISGSPAAGYSSSQALDALGVAAKESLAKGVGFHIVICRSRKKQPKDRADLFLSWHWCLYFLSWQHNMKAGVYPSAFCWARHGRSWERCWDCF